MENQSLTPKEIELHDKLKRVGEIILWYFRTRESERTYLSLTHGRGSKSWLWLNLCANNAAKYTINYATLPISHDMKFSIIYGNDTILSGQMFVDNGVLSLYWNNWWRFVSIALNANAGECAPAFNDKPIYPDLVDQKDLLAILNLISTNLDVAIVTAVQKKPEEPEELKEIAEEHDKEVLSEFCNTLKEFSEEYADSWLINKFNKLIGALKTYCFEINQIDRHKKSTVRISYNWSYMFNRNLLPPVTMTGDRYHYDYNPTSFKIFDMYDSNGDLMVKVDHETFEINFYFYHSATEPFLTISAIDYMGHVKQSYYDSHNHMDEVKFKYLIELIEKELKIQIINPFVDPVIVDLTCKDTGLVSEIIEGSSVVNDTWRNPDPINTTNFKGVMKIMTFAKLRTIVLSWISQNIMGDDIFSAVTTSHAVPGVPIKITVTEFGWIKRDLSINFNNDQTEFTIYEGFFGILNSRVITIRCDKKTNSQDVEFNNNCRFADFSRERMLSLYNTICTEMGKESNAVSAFTPPSTANIVNRYGNMSASPRYEVKDAFEMADGSKVITGLKLLSMNIVKPRRNRDFTGEWVRIIPRIKSVLFNEKKKVTTIIWNDNTKTMAKCTDDDDYDEEIGVAICIAKKYYDNNQNQMRKEINKFKTRQKKHEDAVQTRLDKKNKSTEIVDNKPNEVKVDDDTDNIIG